MKEKVLPVNYEAQKWMTWFSGDFQIAQDLCNQVFRGNQISDDPEFLNLLNAADKSILEVEDDVAKIKNFLAAYKTEV